MNTNIVDIKLVAFDFDGVLVNSEMEYLKTQQQFVVEKYGKYLSLDELTSLIGLDWDSHYLWLSQKLNVSKSNISSEYETYIQYVDYNYEEMINQEAIKFIKKIRKKGIKTAIVTNSEMHILSKFFESSSTLSKENFDYIIAYSEELNGKPEPDLYCSLLEKSGLKAKEVISIEDSASGIESSNAAGIISIGLRNNEYYADLKKANKVIRSFVELDDLL